MDDGDQAEKKSKRRCSLALFWTSGREKARSSREGETRLRGLPARCVHVVFHDPGLNGSEAPGRLKPCSGV